jgi:hypothetical protein
MCGPLGKQELAAKHTSNRIDHEQHQGEAEHMNVSNQHRSDFQASRINRNIHLFRAVFRQCFPVFVVDKLSTSDARFLWMKGSSTAGEIGKASKSFSTR